MNEPYSDIINLPHHVSPTKAQMPIADRAAQFSPFAALTGHSAAIEETARLTMESYELSEKPNDMPKIERMLLADWFADE